MNIYDADKHVGQPCFKGLNGKIYVQNQVSWIIRKVSDASIAKSKSAVGAHYSNRVRPSNLKSPSFTEFPTTFYPMR